MENLSDRMSPMKDLKPLKDALNKELKTLEEELKTVGTKNPEVPGDWVATEGDLNTDAADDAEVADGIENLETNTAVLTQLEKRLIEVREALEKMDKGTYGVCEICGKKIEDDRLNANPAAATCKEHMNE